MLVALVVVFSDSKRYGVVHISTGDLLRAAVKQGTPLGYVLRFSSLIDASALLYCVLRSMEAKVCMDKGRRASRRVSACDRALSPRTGELVPDALIIGLVKNRLAQPGETDSKSAICSSHGMK